jgi:hypothetical protein
MDIKPWNEVIISEPEAALFIYLLFRKDFGYRIAQEFSKGIKNKKWDDRRGLGSLKHANLVESILIGMARKNLLIELPRPGVGRPKNNSIKADMVNNPRRKYYRVNANVLAMTHSVALTEKDINAMRKYIRGSEVYSFDPDDLPIEAQIQYYDPAQIALNRRDEDWSWVNSINVSAALCLLELCAPDELSCIEFINTLKEYDYLTILMTAKTLFQEILDFISPDLHAVSFHDSRYIIPLDLSEEELKERIRKWFNDTCEYIAENKEKRLNNIIGWALRYKKDISLRKHDLNFLRFGNIDKNLRQIIKEFGIAYDKWSMTEYLKDIINHLDDLINRIPYIERGLRSP